MIAHTTTGIQQSIHGQSIFWDAEKLFTAINPLDGETIEAKNEALDFFCQQVTEQGITLSARALDCHYFWTQLQRQHLPELKYSYALNDQQQSQWDVLLNSQGLFYKDHQGKYNGTPGTIYHQVFSDFWFHGPSYPIPDLNIRQWLVATIRNAFRQIGPVSRQHFPLHEYPPLTENKIWEQGDHQAAEFVIHTPYGIETGRTNWHDGLVYLQFISFERMLCKPHVLPTAVTPTIQQHIYHWLVPPPIPPPLEEDHRISQERMKQVYMDNGGKRYAIHFDLGEDYQPDPGNEALWKAELIASLKSRLLEGTDPDLIRHWMNSLYEHGVREADAWLEAAGASSAPKVRQAIAQVLREDYNNDAAVATTLSLLEFEDGSDYWNQHVFSQLGKMPDHTKVKAFIAACLEGKDAARFRHAVGVLQYWGAKGDHFFQDKTLINALKWEEATSGDLDFQSAIEKIKRRLQV